MTVNKPHLKWKCESCNRRIMLYGKQSILSRGYWWHRKCARLLDNGSVVFPSKGKLLYDNRLLFNRRPT